MGNFISNSTYSEISKQNKMLKQENINLKNQVTNLKKIINKDKHNFAIYKKEILEEEKSNEMLDDEEIQSIYRLN